MNNYVTQHCKAKKKKLLYWRNPTDPKIRPGPTFKKNKKQKKKTKKRPTDPKKSKTCDYFFLNTGSLKCVFLYVFHIPAEISILPKMPLALSQRYEMFNLPTLFLFSPLRQYNNFFFCLSPGTQVNEAFWGRHQNKIILQLTQIFYILTLTRLIGRISTDYAARCLERPREQTTK